jgi:hypothetical protein
MKNKQVIKSSALRDGELELINKYTRRELSADEVYVFSVVLCDNDVDRDFERFTVESLEKLSNLFVGKTGIFDHNPKAQNQSARIISCELEAVQGKKNSVGDDYFRIVARAYMPVTDGNEELRMSIDSGITREVSVGCAVEKTVCSICKNEMNSCECAHIKGETYNNELCFGELVNPFDAYEFSFVAVPSQRNAGVIKSFKRKESKMSDILKMIENGGALTLSDNDSKKLKSYIESLKKQAADGAVYRNTLISDVLKYSAIVQPEISRATMKSVTDGLSIDELKEFKTAYKKMLDKNEVIKPQLFAEKNDSKEDKNTQFKI